MGYFVKTLQTCLTNVPSYYRSSKREQIFLTIYNAAQKADLVTDERSLTMPLFSVKSELKMEKYLKKVNGRKRETNGQRDKWMDR